MAVTLETVSDKVELGKAYFLELCQYDLAQEIAGFCTQYTQKLTCLNRLIRALTWDINGDYNTNNTQRLYDLLLVQISTYSGSVLPNDPSVVIPGQTVMVLPGDVELTEVVFPGDGETSYTFDVLIGQQVLTVYRGTGTILRAHSGSANNEFAQFNSATGEITVSWPFGDGESLWVEYKTV